MAITDLKIDKSAQVGRKVLPVSIITAVSLTGAVVFSYQPEKAYQITRVRSFCRTKAGAASAVVKVGSGSAASVTFTAATEVAQTVSSTLATARGSASEPITIELTTDGTGALTNGFVTIEYRHVPQSGEAYSV